MSRMPGLFLTLTLLTGCSTHPCADFSDRFFPGRLGPNAVQPYGGVCIQQGPLSVPTPIVPTIGSPVPLPPGGGVIPPPLPLPGSRPATGFQLQPPQTGDVPPLPPTPPPTFGR